jgi:hypothetical protein
MDARNCPLEWPGLAGSLRINYQVTGTQLRLPDANPRQILVVKFGAMKVYNPANLN